MLINPKQTRTAIVLKYFEMGRTSSAPSGKVFPRACRQLKIKISKFSTKQILISKESFRFIYREVYFRKNIFFIFQIFFQRGSFGVQNCKSFNFNFSKFHIFLFKNSFNRIKQVLKQTVINFGDSSHKAVEMSNCFWSFWPKSEGRALPYFNFIWIEQLRFLNTYPNSLVHTTLYMKAAFSGQALLEIELFKFQYSFQIKRFYKSKIKVFR